MTTTDRELLERAAKAAGIDGRWDEFRCAFRVFMDGGIFLGDEWNPLTDDGDALRLAVKLRMDVNQFQEAVRADYNIDGEWDSATEMHNGDPYAATRRAIVRAAAAMAGEGE